MTKRLTFLLCCLFCCMSAAYGQNMQVNGTVISAEDNLPIIGATVLVKGTSVGTVTDIDGNFTISVPADHKILQFSYVGMATKEETAKPVMRIVLESASLDLDEVIVVAYGTAKKSSFTGSASSVNARDLDLRPINSVTQALQGAAAGVQVNSSNGQPGDSPEVRIRGFGTINASATPLYVVDGAIYDGSIADINTADIENMTILKDAASTSLYGSSAGNGVILITTKRGNSDKPSITFNITQGFTKRGIKEYDRVNIWEYYPLMWEQMRNEYASTGKTPAEANQLASAGIFEELYYNPFRGIANDQIVLPDGSLNPNATDLLWGDDLDWISHMQRTGYRGEYNVNYSAKTEKSDMYVSLGYLDDNGYVIKSDFQRYSGRANVNIAPVRWMKTGLNLSATRSKSSVINTKNNSLAYVNPFYFTRMMGPIYPVYEHNRTNGDYILDSNGNRIYDYMNQRGSAASSGRHVIAETLWNDNQYSRDGINGRTYLDIIPYDGIKLTVNASLENSNENTTRYNNKQVGDGQGAGRLTKTNKRRSTYTFNQLIAYNKTFGYHGIDALLGHENYSYTYEYTSGLRQNEAQAGLLAFENFTEISDLSSYTNTYKKEGYFLRLNYDYNDRYYGSFSFRHDGSSRFTKENRWGNFWSLGASWRIDHEAFMESTRSWLNSLKIRGSYGQTGNDASITSDPASDYDSTIDFYPAMTLYELGYANGTQAGLVFYRFGNPDLKWETQVSYDVGVEFSLFDRLSGTIEYFGKQSKDLLFEVPTPPSSGVKKIWRNIGKVANTGVEIEMNAVLFKNQDWTWNLGFNLTYVDNKIKKLPNDQDIINETKKLQVGKSIYQYWLKEYKGVNPDNGSAVYRFDSENQDWDPNTCYVANGDSLTTNQALAKYHFAGSAIPKVYGGINTSVKYKGLELSAVFTYQAGGKAYDSSYRSLMSVNQYGQAMHKDILKRWQQPGDITDVPRLDSGEATNFNVQSDRWLVSSNSFAIKTLALSYSLPRGFTNRFGVQNARVSFSGENLYMSSKLKGMNPWQSFDGISDNQYLPTRTFTFGLNVTL